MSLSNTRVTKGSVLAIPTRVKKQCKASFDSQATVERGRVEIENILTGRDNRLILIVGPCSIHDRKSALQYAGRLANKRAIYKSKLCIIMRAYFEKPRTSVGWKGFINDPFLDGSCKVNEGFAHARKILCRITHSGLPVATEFVDVYTPQYLDDLISWTAVGARTVESQMHREMASGLSTPVGFKNGTGGDVQVVADAMIAAHSKHTFRGIDDETGKGCLFTTTGNHHTHLVLRGGKLGANYGPENVSVALDILRRAGVSDKILIDCSHANLTGDYRHQPNVARSVVEQRNAGNHSLIGMMIESHLRAGRQDIHTRPLEYGKSVTDACLDWDTTADMLAEIYETVQL